MQLLLGVLVTVLCGCGTQVRGELTSMFIYDYLAGTKLTARWEKGEIPEQFLDTILDLYVPVSEAVENELCRNHSLQYKQAIKNKELWAWYMLEASGMVPAGLMTGSKEQLGNYDGCLMLQTKPKYGFSGQHCTVSLAENDNSLVYGNGSEEMMYIDGSAILDNMLFDPKLKWSVCIPSTCSPRDLELHLRSVLQDLVGDLTITVKDNACRTKDQPVEFGVGGWFTIVLLILFAIIVILSTVYDLKYSKSESRSALLASFSFYTNGSKLLTLSKGGDNLRAVHGIRTLSMMTIVIGHIYEDALYKLPSLNFDLIQTFHFDLAHIGVMNYRLAVDTFFLLGGMLVSYVFLRERQKGKPINIPLYYLHRYIRLTPAYAAMILLTATILGQSGDGPRWEDTIQRTHGNCVNNWWLNLLYLNNYIRPLDTCLDQCWYLSADMHLYLLSPLILIPLWRWQRFAKAIVGVSVFFGIMLCFCISIFYELGVYKDAEELNVMWYLPTHMRFVPWVMGVGLGYVLHKARAEPLELSRRQLVIGWLLCAVCLVGPLFVNRKFTEDDELSVMWISSILALNKPVFILGVAWIILACSQGYGGPLNTFLSWNVFEVLARLTFTVYLVHEYFVSFNAGTLRNVPYISDRHLLMQFFSVLTISFLAATLLYLVFEAPALIIERILLGDGEQRNKDPRKDNMEKLNSGEPSEGCTLINILDGRGDKQSA